MALWLMRDMGFAMHSEGRHGIGKGEHACLLGSSWLEEFSLAWAAFQHTVDLTVRSIEECRTASSANTVEMSSVRHESVYHSPHADVSRISRASLTPPSPPPPPPHTPR